MLRTFLSRRDRITLRLLGAFFLIMAVLVAAAMAVATRITAQSLEARASSQLSNDSAIVQLDLEDLEERLSFYGQLLADTELLTDELAHPTVSRSLMISTLSNIRRHRIRARVFKSPAAADHASAELIRRGFLGIRSTTLTRTTGSGMSMASIETVVPIETTQGVDRVLIVSFPLTRAYLQELRRRISSEITFDFGAEQPLSTLPGSTIAELQREIEQQDLVTTDLEHPLLLESASAGGPAKTLVSQLRIGARPEGLILLTMPMSDLVAAKRTLVAKSFLSAGLILVVAGLLYYSLIRRITKPLEELSAATRDIAQGNLDLHVEVTTEDEVGELATSFNLMVQRLKESREEIESWNRALEQRVEERTHSLQKAQKELKSVNQQLVQAVKDLRHTQESMIHTEKLAAMGQLASAIAHEVKNPLAGMRSALELVISDLSNPDSAEVLQRTVEQVDRLSGTTSRLLTFARPTEPLLKLARIGELVEKTRFLIEQQATRQGVELCIDLEKRDRLLSLDPQLTTQAFLNVSLNALQVMERGGKLAITSRADNDRLIVSFVDTGEGMPPELLEQIFTPFFTTKKYGTGLGLSVVKSIIERQGGEVTISSTPGQGTEVRISFSLHGEPQSAEENQAGS
jgi:signal transduction histidine kinase